MTLMVLLVEDDLDLAATIHDFLDLEGISCDHASNGLAGLNLARAGRYDGKIWGGSHLSYQP